MFDEVAYFILPKAQPEAPNDTDPSIRVFPIRPSQQDVDASETFHEETFTTPVEPMTSENDHSDNAEKESIRNGLETDCSEWITETVYIIGLFAELNSELSALMTPADLGYFRNLNNRDRINTVNIDTNIKAFHQLQERFNDKKNMINQTKMLIKEFFHRIWDF